MKNIKQICLLCAAASSVIPAAGQNASLSGAWEGKLNVGGGLPLIIHVNAEEREVTLDSPLQGATDIPVRLKWLSADSINFSVPNLMLSYGAGLHDGKLEGTFRQATVTMPLVMQPVAEKRRPQTPVAPFPYSTEELVIENKAGNSHLAGTLCLPEKSSASTPLVVMVSGSGLQNRDEEIAGHKPFAVIADHLARVGVATFRYDDRSTGGSEGDAENATTEDFASDARAVVDSLRSTGRFGKIGILGHSEGALVGVMLASETDGPDFLVSLGGPAVDGAQIIASQNETALLDAGLDSLDARRFSDAYVKVLQTRVKTDVSGECADSLVAAWYAPDSEKPLEVKLAGQLKAVLTAELSNPWMAYFVAYDPAEAYRRLRVPVFMLYGEKDCQVQPALNLPRVSELLAFNPAKTEIKVYPGLNHLMQPAQTGRPVEYSEIEETISPEVLEDIARFVNSL